MTDFFTDAVTRTARKHHKCTFCSEQINKGDLYEYQTGNYDGRWYENKMHPECFEYFCEHYDGEYVLYDNDRPEQHEAKGWA